MFLARTTEYALQALVYLATAKEGKPVLNREIAWFLGVPAPYLSKILQQFAREGIVTSQRGRGGGYVLNPAALGTTIRQIVEIVEGDQAFAGCLLGLNVCDSASACPVHHTWSPIKASLLKLLERQTLGAMAEQVRSGRYRIVAPRLARVRRRRLR